MQLQGKKAASLGADVAKKERELGNNCAVISLQRHGRMGQEYILEKVTKSGVNLLHIPLKLCRDWMHDVDPYHIMLRMQY